MRQTHTKRSIATFLKNLFTTYPQIHIRLFSTIEYGERSIRNQNRSYSHLIHTFFFLFHTLNYTTQI